MIRKFIPMIFVTLVVVFLLPATSITSYALPSKVKKAKCTMEPIKVYYDAKTGRQFVPTATELQQASEIYSKMCQGDLKVYVSDTPNIYRIYGIIQTEYFPYVGCRSLMQMDGEESDYVYFKLLNTQSAVNTNREIDMKVRQTIKKLKIGKKTSQVTALKRINAWICKNMEYDYDRMEEADEEDYSDANYEPSILSGSGLCGDYARTFTYLTSYCGINSGCVFFDDVSHEYNLIKIRNKTYYFDVCYNDCTNTSVFSFLSKKKLTKMGHTIGEVRWYERNSYYETVSCYE